MIEIARLKDIVMISYDTEQIIEMTANMQRLVKSNEDTVVSLFGDLRVTQILCLLNLVFFIGQLVQMYFLRKIGRSI